MGKTRRSVRDSRTAALGCWDDYATAGLLIWEISLSDEDSDDLVERGILPGDAYSIIFLLFQWFQWELDIQKISKATNPPGQ